MKSLAYSPPKPKAGEHGLAMPATMREREKFPTLRLNGEQAATAGLSKCAHGEEYEIRIKVRATKIDSQGDWPGNGTSKEKPAMEFDVVAADPPQEVGAKKEERPKGSIATRSRRPITMD
jgi:hypothetical protein